MPTYEQLNQRHPSYDANECADLEALYNGKRLFKARLWRFLPQRQKETPDRWKLRKDEAHYRNYLGAIVDFFAALLFTARPQMVATRDGVAVSEPDEYYGEIVDDIDGAGTDLDAFAKDRLIDAAVYGMSWWVVEAPDVDGGETRAEFDATGAGDCRFRALENSSVLDWESSEEGGLGWVIVHEVSNRRNGIGGSRDTTRETWEYYTAESIDTYAIEYKPQNKPTQTKEVPLESSRPNPFGRVPIVCMDLPKALWIAGQLSDPQLAHFRVSNAQTWGLSQSCYAMPVMHVEDKADPPTMGAGLGIMMGLEEKLEWAAPPSTPFDALANEVKSQKDEIFRLAHQMALGVENNATAIGRSAESKTADAESTRVVMLAFSREVKEALRRGYELIEVRRQDGLEWAVSGLNETTAADANGLIGSLKELEDSGRPIPSKTWNAEAHKRIANQLLPDMSPETRGTVEQEIDAGTEEPVALSQGERDMFRGVPGNAT